MSPIAYERGLHELGDGLFAYLQPHGGWGWSNAGLVTADGTSLLIDTLFDLRLTREMLDAMAKVTARNPIGAAVNTHGDPDHCFGNQLLPQGIDLYATSAAAKALSGVRPELVAGMFASDDLGEDFSAFARRCFGAFDFRDIELRVADKTFDSSLDVLVGDRVLRLIELGPAHTAGDAIVHVPDADVVFTGDLIFVDGTPLIWEGPVATWLAACEQIRLLDARILVPGHGPVSDASSIAEVERYLTYVRDEARARFDAGMDADAAADDIDLADFAGLGDPERIVANVHSLYREFDPSLPASTVPEQFVRMARWASRHR
jgi:glyoxylase-like metal-dependent hydrolase (beta-lactamase superfamily II)